MLYLIGLGLNQNSISIEALEKIKECKKVFLESYTVDFPYKILDIEKVIGKKIISLGREEIESDKLILESKKDDVALLIYGSPLFATTHMTLLMGAKEKKVKTKIIYSASIFDAISETGLQLYKFGKISSMPKWQKNFNPISFLEFIIENNSIEAHSLLLMDIGLDYKNALYQFEESIKNTDKIKIDKILVCSNMGCKNSKIVYGTIEKIKKEKIISPFCFIIPAKMHFLEKEAVERFLV